MRPADQRQESKEVVVECELEATPEKVWRALTVPELAAEWIAPERVSDGETAPSYEMLDALPFTTVRYAWRDEESSEPDTLLTIELSPQPNGHTWFRLIHSAVQAPTTAANSNAPLARAA